MNLTPFESALILHLIGDWLLQNDWMAIHKVRLNHPAAWVHSSIHGVLLGLLFGWAGGLTLGVAHLLIDTRVPLQWWIRVFKKCESSPDHAILVIGCDQVLHVACLAGWITFFGSRTHLPL